MRKELPYIIVMIIGVASGMMLCRQCSRHPSEVVVQRDTLIVCDTVIDWWPLEVRTETIDTMRVVVRDTVRVRDTLYVSLPIDKKLYATDEYYAEVSGYRPSLDYIEVYPKTIYITQTEKVIPIKKNQFSISIGTEYYRVIGVPVQVQYTRNIGRYFGAYSYLEYELQSGEVGAGIGLQATIEW